MARARRPHRNLTAPNWAGTQWRTRRAGKFAATRPRGGPLAGPGKFFRPPGCGRGPRDPELFKSQQERACATAPRKGGDGRLHLRSRSAGQAASGRTVDLDHARSLRSRTGAARRPLPERTRTLRIGAGRGVTRLVGLNRWKGPEPEFGRVFRAASLREEESACSRTTGIREGDPREAAARPIGGTGCGNRYCGLCRGGRLLRDHHLL